MMSSHVGQEILIQLMRILFHLNCLLMVCFPKAPFKVTIQIHRFFRTVANGLQIKYSYGFRLYTLLIIKTYRGGKLSQILAGPSIQ